MQDPATEFRNAREGVALGRIGKVVNVILVAVERQLYPLRADLSFAR
jgi:hypothetical protein